MTASTKQSARNERSKGREPLLTQPTKQAAGKRQSKRPDRLITQDSRLFTSVSNTSVPLPALSASKMNVSSSLPALQPLQFMQMTLQIANQLNLQRGLLAPRASAVHYQLNMQASPTTKRKIKQIKGKLQSTQTPAHLSDQFKAHQTQLGATNLATTNVSPKQSMSHLANQFNTQSTQPGPANMSGISDSYSLQSSSQLASQFNTPQVQPNESYSITSGYPSHPLQSTQQPFVQFITQQAQQSLATQTPPTGNLLQSPQVDTQFNVHSLPTSANQTALAACHPAQTILQASNQNISQQAQHGPLQSASQVANQCNTEQVLPTPANSVATSVGYSLQSMIQAFSEYISQQIQQSLLQSMPQPVNQLNAAQAESMSHTASTVGYPEQSILQAPNQNISQQAHQGPLQSALQQANQVKAQLVPKSLAYPTASATDNPLQSTLQPPDQLATQQVQQSLTSRTTSSTPQLINQFNEQSARPGSINQTVAAELLQLMPNLTHHLDPLQMLPDSAGQTAAVHPLQSTSQMADQLNMQQEQIALTNQTNNKNFKSKSALQSDDNEPGDRTKAQAQPLRQSLPNQPTYLTCITQNDQLQQILGMKHSIYSELAGLYTMPLTSQILEVIAFMENQLVALQALENLQQYSTFLETNSSD